MLNDPQMAELISHEWEAKRLAFEAALRNPFPLAPVVEPNRTATAVQSDLWVQDRVIDLPSSEKQIK
jgi:hypothetical protein